MSDCPFCAIIWDGAPATVIDRNDDIWIIEPLDPVTKGHLLVIPTVHVEDAVENADVSANVMRAASTWLQRQWLRADGRYRFLNLITSVGVPATQSVFHLHLHIVPRYEGDGLHLPWTGQAPLTAKETL